MSNNQPWKPRYRRKPEVDMDSPEVTIRQLRNFKWHSDSEVEPRYDTRTYDFRNLTGVWFGIDTFGGLIPLAHTFLCFEFKSTEYLCVSIEARLREHQAYSPLKGLFGQYEIIYLLADPRDLIGQRVVDRDNGIHLYPLEAVLERTRFVLIDMLERADELTNRASTYNTITNNCTTAILHHANEFSEKPIPYGLPVLLPGLIDRLLRRYDLVRGDEPFEEKKERYLIKDVQPDKLYSDDFELPLR